MFKFGIKRFYELTKDDRTFAIIEDLDIQNRKVQFRVFNEILRAIKPRIAYNRHYSGMYTYRDGIRKGGVLFLLHNVDKATALEVSKKINQEYILWKDDNFFGIIKTDDGSIVLNLNYDLQAMQSIESEQKFTNWFTKFANEKKIITYEQPLYEYDKIKRKSDSYLIYRYDVNGG